MLVCLHTQMCSGTIVLLNLTLVLLLKAQMSLISLQCHWEPVEDPFRCM